MEEDFDSLYVGYPDRDDPNIQSLLYAKKELRILEPDGPRVDNLYFNTQVLAGIVLQEYGSVMMLSATGSGKTGCFANFESEMRRKHPGAVKNFYYICGIAQQGDFESQFVSTFSAAEDRAKHRRGGEARSKRKILKEHFILRTYDQISKEIAKRSNSDLLRDFGNAAFMFDELHTMKIEEKIDYSKLMKNTPRPRLEMYANILRLTRICPDAYYLYVTATPTTNKLREFAYHFMLMPDALMIDRPLARAIIDYINYTNADRHPRDAPIVIPEEKWKVVNIEAIEALDPDFIDHSRGVNCEGLPLNEDEYVKEVDYRAIEELTVQLEEVIRGRVIYVRAPDTGVEQVYPNSEYDTCSHRNLRTLTMDTYQGECYSRYILNEGNKSKEEIIRGLYDQDDHGEVAEDETGKQTKKGKTVKGKKKRKGDEEKKSGAGLYLLPKQAAVIVFPPVAYIEAILAGKTIDILDERNNAYRASVGPEAAKQHFEVVTEKKLKTVADYKTKPYAGVIEKKGVLGTANVNKLVIKKHFANFVSHPRLGDRNLRSISAKFYEIVKYLERADTGLAYISDEYYSTNVLALASILVSRPLPPSNQWNLTNTSWKEFKESIPTQWIKDGQIIIAKAPRFLLYTSATDEKIRNEGLDLARHPANVNGDYIKAIIATELGSLGININHATAAFFNIPRFTPAMQEQAKGRVLRPNSHTALIAQRNARFPSKIGTPFEVELNYMVVVPNEEVVNYYGEDVYIPSIDSLLYRVIYEKDFYGSFLARLYKSMALDAPINLKRNVRPTDIPGSRDMDYQIEPLAPYNCDTTLPVDMSTYSRYYNADSSDAIFGHIKEYCSIYNCADIMDVISTISTVHGYPHREIATLIREIIETTRVVLIDRYGYKQYLAEYHGMIYLTRDPFAPYESALEIYSAQVNYIETLTLDSYATQDVNIDTEIGILESGDFGDDVNSNYWFAKQSAYKKVALFEKAWLTPEGIKWADLVIEACKMLFFYDESVKICVHEVELLYSKTTNYNAVDGILRPTGRLRICVNSIWRYANEQERAHYAKLMTDATEAKLQKYYSAHADIGVIAIIVRPNRVHIREFVYDEIKGMYFGSEGTKCSGLKPYSIIGMIYKATLGIEEVTLSQEDEELYVNVIQNYFTNIAPSSINALRRNHTKLAWYYDTISTAQGGKLKKSRLCNELCLTLLERGAVFTVIGDAELTIARATT